MPRPVTTGAHCAPLDVDQARAIVAAISAPAMIAEITDAGLSVQAVDPLLRRFISGGRHPAGPVPGEILRVEDFGALAPALATAMTPPFPQQVFEVPIGDEPQWFEITVTVIADEDRARQLVVVGADRTAEHDLEHRQRRAARRFEAMIEHTPGLILLVDSAGRILKASPGVERSVGLDARQLIGRAIFEILHPDTLARAATMFNQVLSLPGETIEIDDFRVGHTDGSYLWCEAAATNLLHDDDVAAIVFNAHDVTDRRLAEERLELEATTDALTGLPNRNQLRAELQRAFADASRSATSVGLALIDLDDLKLVNDALGHDVGDTVLRTTASRLCRLAGDRGVVARIGGDEFAVLVPELTDGQTLDAFAAAVHDAMEEAVETSVEEVFVQASIGISRAAPTISDPDALLRSADLALYRAKRNGRNQTVAFTAELQLEAEERLATVTALQRALREGRLRLVYQPVVRIDGALVGAEALLRWEHDGEMLPPNAFLDLAEDTGLILAIGAWVIEQACRDVHGLRSAAPDLRWVSINLSSRQLLDQRLSDVLARATAAAGLDPTSLAVEINETTIRDHPETLAVLTDLRPMTVMLALDDVGTNQDILRSIDGLSIDAVKLDRPFVQQLDVDPDDQHRALAAAVLDRAAEMGLDVVAEGVETKEQMEVLRDLGCPLVQGYLYSEPLDLGSFITRARR